MGGKHTENIIIPSLTGLDETWACLLLKIEPIRFLGWIQIMQQMKDFFFSPS